MSSLGTSKGILEIAKFGLYITVPVVLMYTFANNSQNLKKVMGNGDGGERLVSDWSCELDLVAHPRKNQGVFLGYENSIPSGLETEIVME